MNKKHLLMLMISLAFSFTAALPVSASAGAENSGLLENRIYYVYDDSNGLPTAEANTILQTSDGYMWIGSYGGLIRYDGISFYNYSENGFPSSSIRHLFEDSSGRLWIGTNDMGVYYFENGEFVHIEYEDKTKFLSVRSFAEDKDGKIYIGATSGLAVVTEDNQLKHIAEEISSTVYSIAVDKYGVLWACIDNGIARQIKDERLLSTFNSTEHLKSALYCAGTSKDGTLYLGTSDNYIYKAEFYDDLYAPNSYRLTEYNTGSVATFNAIEEDEKGNIWAAGLSGMGYFDPEMNFHDVTEEHAAAVVDIDFDYEGNVWAASSNYGVLHIVEGLFYNPNKAAGLTDTSINTVAVTDDAYYLGTDTGLIILNSRFAQVTNELTEMLEGERIRNIKCDSKGNVWIGTYYQNGLIMYTPSTEKITQYTTENGLCNSQMRMILELADGSIAASSQHGVSIIRDGAVTATYSEEEGINYPIILSLCEGKDGTLYAGSDGQGIYAIKEGNVTHYSFDEGLTAGVVLRMLLDENGEGMFISAGNALYYWDFNEFRLLDNYRKSPGSVFDLKLQGDQLWLMQSNGINMLNKESLLSGRDTNVQILGSSYGLTATLNANTWNCEKDGILYLCTSNGLSMLELSALGGEDAEIKAAINQVTVDGKAYYAPETIQLEGGATRLTFDFAPLSFSGKEVRVRYRLKGFEENMTTLVNKDPMSASYTNLSGGNYEFCIEVLAADNETVINKITIPVHKDYLLWEMAWFWIVLLILIFALVILAAVLVSHIKTARLKKRQKEYRHIIGESLRTFANAIDAKDKYTNGHSIRVATYSLELAKKLELSEEEQERIYYIALLHDIGKIGITDKILNKAGKLTDEEIGIIRQHPAIGGEILKDFNSIPGISEGARYHHERYDGTGYNEGLKGEEIPFFARIICVADSYDTMSGGRHYKESMDNTAVIEELERCSGKQFDPKIVKLMIELITEGKAPVRFETGQIEMFYE